jgi:hypothetical protein
MKKELSETAKRAEAATLVILTEFPQSFPIKTEVPRVWCAEELSETAKITRSNNRIATTMIVLASIIGLATIVQLIAEFWPR